MNKPKITQFTKVLLTAASFTVSTVAFANPDLHSDGRGKFMSFFDSNNDNVVTMEELNTASIKRFSSMDTDKNGHVTKEEFINYVSERRSEYKKHQFTNIDTNKDNQISVEEFLAYKAQQARQHYDQLDSNHDGILTPDEYTSRKYGKHRDEHHRSGYRIFEKLDKNGDGEVTLDESLAAWRDWFKRIDANNDQVVTTEEVQNFRSNMRDK